MKYKLLDTKDIKAITSKEYNSLFYKKTGKAIRFGKTLAHNPSLCPLGPEILDIEISTICGSKYCKGQCYKKNTSVGKNMSLGTFQQVLSVIPKEQLQQIAFGIGHIDGNPDLWDIMKHTRDQGVVPNITINGEGMQDWHFEKLASLCGAVSVSKYNKHICYDTVEKLVQTKNQLGDKATLQQVNIHCVVSEENMSSCWELLQDMEEDRRLKDLNASVFLLLKPKGLGTKLTQLTALEPYKALVEHSLNRGLRIGMDSCSACNFLKATEGGENFSAIEQQIDPCESGLFSFYINVDGEGFPCSFAEGTIGWKTGINMLKIEDFRKEVWFSDRVIEWRKDLLATKKYNKFGCRECPIYDLEME